MATITRELLRKRSEHNECMISTMEEVRTEPQLRRKGDLKLEEEGHADQEAALLTSLCLR